MGTQILNVKGMFDPVESAPVSAEAYKAAVPSLRASLLDVQRRLRSSASFPVIIVLTGFDAAGRSETANLLNAWMDPRWIVTRAWGEASDEERERPLLWRYWRALPPRGRIGVLLGAWYEPAIYRRVERSRGGSSLATDLRRIATFEQALTDDGALIIKFWMHLDADRQRRRLKAFARDPLRRWRVTKQQWRNLRRHDDIKRAAAKVMRATTTDQAPWLVVQGWDERSRSLTVATALRDLIHARIAEATRRRRRSSDRTNASPAVPVPDVLGALDLGRRIPRKRFADELERQQGRLNRLQREAVERGLSTLVVFEGWDAAGKGGAVRRVTGALDARDYQVVPIAAPSDEELAHHYLWRFMRHLPRAGRVLILDRSYYGRVLVERIEGLASPFEVERAYPEIGFFESQLIEHGMLVVKFWLHISKDEQLRRFRDRARTPHKRWKITEDDWRNRRRWGRYEAAVNEMVARTGWRQAPWVLVEANDKRFARVKVVRTLANRLARALKR